MQNKEIIFFTPPYKETGVSRIRDDGGAQDVLYNIYKRTITAGEIVSGYWECFAGEIIIESAPTNEICFITEGSAIIIKKNGEERIATVGDVLLIPKGAYSHWLIMDRVKKVYFIVVDTNEN